MKKTSFHILVAEDDMDDRLLIQDAFTEIGIATSDITYVNDGEELLNYLQDKEILPSLIFLDLNMPKMDGREALKEIKKNADFKHIPVIVFSTSSSQDDIILSYTEGSNTYFTKPTLFTELVEMLRTIKDYWFDKAVLS